MLELKTQEKDKVVIVGQKEIEKKQELIGSIKPHKGHTLFEFDRKAFVLRKAKFEEGVADFRKEASKNPLGNVHRKVIVKEGCFYLMALNPKNAIRKLIKLKMLIPKK